MAASALECERKIWIGDGGGGGWVDSILLPVAIGRCCGETSTIVTAENALTVLM
jgi:hypothetical protein